MPKIYSFRGQFIEIPDQNNDAFMQEYGHEAKPASKVTDGSKTYYLADDVFDQAKTEIPTLRKLGTKLPSYINFTKPIDKQDTPEPNTTGITRSMNVPAVSDITITRRQRPTEQVDDETQKIVDEKVKASEGKSSFMRALQIGFYNTVGGLGYGMPQMTPEEKALNNRNFSIANGLRSLQPSDDSNGVYGNLQEGKIKEAFGAGIRSALESQPLSATAMGLALIPVAGRPLSGLYTFKTSYGMQKQSLDTNPDYAGMTESQKNMNAVLYGLTDAVSEQFGEISNILGWKKLIKNVGKEQAKQQITKDISKSFRKNVVKDIGKQALKSLRNEVLFEEVPANIAQNTVDYLTGATDKLDPLKNTFDTIVVSSLATLPVIGLGGGGTTISATRVYQALKQTETLAKDQSSTPSSVIARKLSDSYMNVFDGDIKKASTLSDEVKIQIDSIPNTNDAKALKVATQYIDSIIANRVSELANPTIMSEDENKTKKPVEVASEIQDAIDTVQQMQDNSQPEATNITPEAQSQESGQVTQDAPEQASLSTQMALKLGDLSQAINEQDETKILGLQTSINEMLSSREASTLSFKEAEAVNTTLKFLMSLYTESKKGDQNVRQDNKGVREKQGKTPATGMSDIPSGDVLSATPTIDTGNQAGDGGISTELRMSETKPGTGPRTGAEVNPGTEGTQTTQTTKNEGVTNGEVQAQRETVRKGRKEEVASQPGQKTAPLTKYSPKLVRTEWISKIEDIPDKLEGSIAKRVSDWDHSLVSELSNRNIVHAYWIEQNGELKPYGINSAAKILGWSESRKRREITKSKNESINRLREIKNWRVEAKRKIGYNNPPDNHEYYSIVKNNTGFMGMMSEVQEIAFLKEGWEIYKPHSEIVIDKNMTKQEVVNAKKGRTQTQSGSGKETSKLDAGTQERIRLRNNAKAGMDTGTGTQTKETLKKRAGTETPPVETKYSRVVSKEYLKSSQYDYPQEVYDFIDKIDPDRINKSDLSEALYFSKNGIDYTIGSHEGRYRGRKGISKPWQWEIAEDTGEGYKTLMLIDTGKTKLWDDFLKNFVKEFEVGYTDKKGKEVDISKYNIVRVDNNGIIDWIIAEVKETGQMKKLMLKYPSQTYENKIKMGSEWRKYVEEHKQKTLRKYFSTTESDLYDNAVKDISKIARSIYNIVKSKADRIKIDKNEGIAYIYMKDGRWIEVNTTEGLVSAGKSGQIKLYRTASLHSVITIGQAYNHQNFIAYHEGFHLVYDMLLSDTERKILHDNLGDEEMIADAFARYMIEQDTHYKPSVKLIFKRLWLRFKNFLNNAFGKEIANSAEEVFRNMRASSFSKNATQILGSADKGKTGTSEEEVIRKQYENTDKWMKAPNGNPTNLNERQWLQVRTPSFKNWFGDWENDPENASKVVDENGEPKVIYSGHSNTMLWGNSFDPKKSVAGAFYATEDSEIAGNYALDKFGDYRSYEHGSEYMIKNSEGEYKTKLKNITLNKEQRQIIDNIVSGKDIDEDSIVYNVYETYYWAKMNKDNDPVARRLFSLKYNLVYLYDAMSDLGYTYSPSYDDSNKPHVFKQKMNDFEYLLEHLGLDWSSYLWDSPGVFPLFMNIKNPLELENFPPKLIKELSDYADSRKENSWQKDSHWTADYSPKEWVKSIKEKDEFWSTQIPSGVIPIIEKYGFDGIKELGLKNLNLPESQRQKNWISFQPTQIKSATANVGTFDSNNPDIRFSDIDTQNEIMRKFNEALDISNGLANRWQDLAKRAGDMVHISEEQALEKFGRHFRSDQREFSNNIESILDATSLNDAGMWVAMNKPKDWLNTTFSLEDQKQFAREFELSQADYEKLGKNGWEFPIRGLQIKAMIETYGQSVMFLKSAIDSQDVSESEKIRIMKSLEKIIFALSRAVNKYDEMKTSAGRLLRNAREKADTVKWDEIMRSLEIGDGEVGEDEVKRLLDKIDPNKPASQIPNLIKPTFWDFLNAMYYFNILSGISTNMKNIISTSVNIAMETSLSVFDNPKFLELAKKAMKESINQAPKNFVSDFIDPKHNKFDLASPVFSNRIMKALQVVSRLMSAEDAFMQTFASNLLKASIALDKAKGNVNEARLLYDNPTDDMIIQLSGEATKATYNNRNVEGVVGIATKAVEEIISIVGEHAQPLQFLIKTVVPFTRIVGNVLNSQIDYTPLGYLRAFAYRKGTYGKQGGWKTMRGFQTDLWKGKESPFARRDFMRQMTRATMGTIMMGSLFALATVTGSGGKDRRKKEQFRDLGWQPNSIKIGNTWVSYQNWGALGMAMAIVGNWQDNMRLGLYADKDMITKTALTLYGTAGTFMSMSFISGINDLLSAVSTGNASWAKRYIGTTMANITPVMGANLIKQINDLFDTDMRVLHSVTEYYMFATRPLSKLYGENNIPKRINSLGETVNKTNNWSYFIGMPLSREKIDSPFYEILKETAKNNVFIPAIPTKVTIPIGDNANRKLEGSELEEFQHLRGRNVAIMLLDNKTNILALCKANDTEELNSIMNEIGKEATAMAKEKMINRLYNIQPE